MKTLKLNETETIEFASEFFDESVLRGFMDFEADALSLAEAEKLSEVAGTLATARPSGKAKPVARPPRKGRTPARPLKEMSLDEVFHTVFDELQTDEDFGDYIRENRMAVEREVEKEFVGRVRRRIKPKVFKHNMESFQVDRDVSRGVVTYKINGEPALSYSQARLTTARASWLETLVAWCKLIWDTIGFIGSVLEIYTPKATSKRVNVITKLVDRAKATWAKFIERMKQIKWATRAKEKIDVILKAFEVAGLGKLALDVAKAMWRSMSWREWLWAVAQFSAALVLFFVTAGVTLIQKLVRAAAKLVNVIQDVIVIINLGRGTSAVQRAVA